MEKSEESSNKIYSIYKGVRYLLNSKSIHIRKRFGKAPWQAYMRVNGIMWTGPARNNERDAALDYDKKRIELNKEPLNILKPLS